MIWEGEAMTRGKERSHDTGQDRGVNMLHLLHFTYHQFMSYKVPLNNHVIRDTNRNNQNVVHNT